MLVTESSGSTVTRAAPEQDNTQAHQSVKTRQEEKESQNRQDDAGPAISWSTVKISLFSTLPEKKCQLLQISIYRRSGTTTPNARK